jgi:hypothetical protein
VLIPDGAFPVADLLQLRPELFRPRGLGEGLAAPDFRCDRCLRCLELAVTEPFRASG